ncbi:cyclophilin-like fold protein [Thalassospira marina]|uniref:cyclophilin-like fold protein n=1 Tax=Thalassospira marina TaxID=2048283 RepID=UPI0012FF3F07|nr:cyclophilin-like fold protein [Thalassospira marina]
MQASMGATVMKVSLLFDDDIVQFALQDNPTARDLLALVPFDVHITDFGQREAIGFLQRPLAVSGPLTKDLSIGDLAYFPKGPYLSVFHNDQRPIIPTSGAIIVGRAICGLGNLAFYDGVSATMMSAVISPNQPSHHRPFAEAV